MDSRGAAEKLSQGLADSSADDITEALCNLRDGTCDAVELIPLLERVALQRFWRFDDNGAGGMPHPTGDPVSFREEAREAIENIRQNQKLESPSPIARLLKSLNTQFVASALRELAKGNDRDETLLPILEKIARKDKYESYSESYSYYGGSDPSPARLGEMARTAIRRIWENIGAAAVVTCRLCATIPGISTANTGRDEHFGPPITSLKRHELDRDNDLFECPECGALFQWHDDRSWTGSGNNDEETLTRFPAAHAAVLRELVHRAGRAIDDPAALAGRLLRLPAVARDLAAIHLRQRDRELARQLVPALVETAADGNEWSAEFLKSFTSTPEDAVLVLGLLEAHTASPALAELRAHARTVACSICSSLDAYPPPKLRRDALPAKLAMLKQLGASERNDLWECAECESLFHWQSEDGIDGGLTRVTGLLADALRKCVHRTGTVDERPIETVFACGREWQQLLYEHSMRRDPELVMRLVPRMVSSLARNPQPWLHDALCEVARDPFGAAAVRAAIAKIERANSLIESLAAHARAT